MNVAHSEAGDYRGFYPDEANAKVATDDFCRVISTLADPGPSRSASAKAALSATPKQPVCSNATVEWWLSFEEKGANCSALNTSKLILSCVATCSNPGSCCFVSILAKALIALTAIPALASECSISAIKCSALHPCRQPSPITRIGPATDSVTLSTDPQVYDGTTRR